MATGLSNKLVGQVGEFLVCAELGRRGLIATPFAGNVPGYDVIATNKHFLSAPIQVKANNGKRSWQFKADKFLQIDYNHQTQCQTVVGSLALDDADVIHVLVWLGHHTQVKDRFFILDKRELQSMISGHYSSYLARHGGKRPKKPESRHTAVRLAELGEYENRWQLIEDRLAGQH